jgi:prophage regulatory protein
MMMERITRFLRLPAVIEMVGLQRTAIYGRIKAGTFPKPVQLGPRAVAWDEQELAEWQGGLTRGVKEQLN